MGDYKKDEGVKGEFIGKCECKSKVPLLKSLRNLILTVALDRTNGKSGMVGSDKSCLAWNGQW